MAKRTVTLYLDDDLVQNAKDKKINISQAVNSMLREIKSGRVESWDEWAARIVHTEIAISKTDKIRAKRIEWLKTDIEFREKRKAEGLEYNEEMYQERKKELEELLNAEQKAPRKR